MPNFDCEEALLFADDELTVYYIATPPGILYPPHEHRMGAISALYSGTETHVFYDRVGENIKERTRITATAPAVVDMEIDVVHAICTSDAVPNEGLHFYFGDLEVQSRTMWNVAGDNPRQYANDDYLRSARPL
jgi:predicted metal-dependent enzyme (double-stranded beta helix superfamily)